MSAAAAILNLVIAAGYIQYFAFLLADLRKSRHLFATVGAPMLAIFATCGLHHAVHGVHELMGEIDATGWEVLVTAVQLPFVLGWAWLRWEKMLGRRGDRRLVVTVAHQRALEAAWALYAGTVVVGTAIQSNALQGLTQGLGESTATLPNLLVAGMYLGIGYRVLRTQCEGERDWWSLSGLLISAYFANCGLSHYVVGAELLGGRYSLDEWHMLVVDWLAVLPAFWFLAGEGILAYARGESPRGPRRGHALPIIALVVLSLQAVLVVHSFTQVKPFRPLDDPTQIVLNRVSGVAGPAVHLGEDLDVTGVKCNRASVPVSITGSMAWMTVNPRGSVYPIGSGSAVRQPGCITFRYANPMPAVVVERTKQLLAQGLTRVQWSITGVETPTRAGGVPEVWATEPFTVIK